PVSDGELALEEALALVGDGQVELVLDAGLELIEDDTAGPQVEVRALFPAGRQLVEDIVQGNIQVRLLPGFLGGADEVRAAQPSQVAPQVAALEHPARLVPLVPAGRDQLVEAPAAPAGG